MRPRWAGASLRQPEPELRKHSGISKQHDGATAQGRAATIGESDLFDSER